MEIVLTGATISAAEAEKAGLVSRVVPNDKVRISDCLPFFNKGIVSNLCFPCSTIQLLEIALATANKIASYSRPAVAMAKETVNASFELNLEEGLRFERRIFHSMFALADQKEGMAAFIEKRPANWTHK
jgi:enoyl-CoA hydratase